MSDSPILAGTPLASVREALAGGHADAAQSQLADIRAVASESGTPAAVRLAGLLGNLLEILSCFDGSDENRDETEEIQQFVADSLPALQDCLDGSTGAADLAREIVELAAREWGEYLSLLPADCRESTEDWPDDNWGDDQALADAEELDASGIDVAALLSGLSGTPGPAEPSAEPPTVSPFVSDVPRRSGTPCGIPEPPDPERPEMDADILEAYTDDATNCLASMEQCLLAIESDPSNVASMQQFCRELHTLKGASGSVGLSNLAGYLHKLEDHIEATHKSGGKLDVDPVLRGVDAIRGQLAVLTGGTPPEPQVAMPMPSAAPTGPALARSPEATPPRPAPGPAAEQETSFVRVEASRLDKLLDLLAELVSLRNRRDTYASGLRDVHTGVGGCVARMRTLTEKLSDGVGTQGDESENFARSASRHATYRARELAELCSDVAELNRSLRDVFDPLSEDNLAVSRLIGEFRRELMDLQRVPVAGLFRRLHRGARDAARQEGKQIEVEFVGGDVRLERSLQERLFEPLLHIVRNAVSHGIEDADRRQQSGKAASGRITLTAHSNATSLVFEVRDDGGGLDFERLEQKGRERGLIPAGASPSRDRLARLIFHPGFSTRTEVSEVSGRGVGMDVVATQVHRMRGRVEIDSATGSGTTIQLQIPLRSAIEHAMVMRCGGQLFAVPMQFVHAARPEAADLPADLRRTPLDEVLALPERNLPGERQIIVLGHHGTRSDATSERVAIEVDDVVGAEEVVVRRLPPLLIGHPLFSGLTLSGQGETVLILDVPRLMRLASGPVGQSRGGHVDQALETPGRERPRVLVVDDSLSTRRTHVRMVRQAGFDAAEAADGLEALDLLKTDDFQAVLTDLEMPRLGGFELVSEIKQRSRIRNLPVIVITSRGDEETHRRLMALGADRVVVKPLTNLVFADLHQLLQEAAEAATAAAVH